MGAPADRQPFLRGKAAGRPAGHPPGSVRASWIFSYQLKVVNSHRLNIRALSENVAFVEGVANPGRGLGSHCIAPHAWTRGKLQPGQIEPTRLLEESQAT